MVKGLPRDVSDVVLTSFGRRFVMLLLPLLHAPLSMMDFVCSWPQQRSPLFKSVGMVFRRFQSRADGFVRGGR